MVNKQNLPAGAVMALMVCVMGMPAAAAPFSITITVDENGHGTLTNTNSFFGNLPFSQITDPGPGGLTGVANYGLLSPPGLVGGDVLLLEPGSLGVVSDLLRFDPATNGGSLFFYSDISDGADSLADVGLPGGLNTNTFSAVEVGPEGNNGFTYTPTAGQPGFVAGASGPVTYDFLSDVPASVPEPSSVFLALSGVGVLWGLRLRSRSRLS
jgi:PEP-CTERM motif-containing protein